MGRNEDTALSTLVQAVDQRSGHIASDAVHEEINHTYRNAYAPTQANMNMSYPETKRNYAVHPTAMYEYDNQGMHQETAMEYSSKFTNSLGQGRPQSESMQHYAPQSSATQSSYGYSQPNDYEGYKEPSGMSSSFGYGVASNDTMPSSAFPTYTPAPSTYTPAPSIYAASAYGTNATSTYGYPAAGFDSTPNTYRAAPGRNVFAQSGALQTGRQAPGGNSSWSPFVGY